MCCGCLASAWDSLDGFFGKCTALHGRQCRVDAVGLHLHACNASDTVSALRFAYERYGRPLWLTELACGGADAKANAAFIREVLPALDALPFVTRYAWYGTRTAALRRPRIA